MTKTLQIVCLDGVTHCVHGLAHLGSPAGKHAAEVVYGERTC